MPLLGSHLSIAGGYHKAVYQAAEYGMQTVQIFTKNNNQWQAKPLTDKDVELFKAAIKETGVKLPCAHDSYLINLASPKPDDWEKSVLAFGIELERAESLGLAGVVAHPGSALDAPEGEALERISQAINRLHTEYPKLKVQTWLETTAGQGSNLGHRFEHLAIIIDQVKDKSRLGVCLDTCHIFAAGYPLKTRQEFTATFAEFDRIVGLKYLRAFHLNDSKKPLGSRVDRHEHLGEGEIGAEVFAWIMQDARFKDLPMYLETKKEQREGIEMDIINLKLLNSFRKPASRKKS
jgi:deoxyribonuclease-4